MNANITRTRFIAANELCAKHLGSRIRIETRQGAKITDELEGIHVGVDTFDPIGVAFGLTPPPVIRVRLKHVRPDNPDWPAIEGGSYFDLNTAEEITVWEPVA